MTTTSTHPYSLEVIPSSRRPGSFEWAIRRDGQLVQRSDRFAPSEQKARDDGEKALERLFSSAAYAR